MLIGGVHFYREFGDGLTDIAIVVHDLCHGETLKQEIMSMLDLLLISGLEISPKRSAFFN